MIIGLGGKLSTETGAKCAFRAEEKTIRTRETVEKIRGSRNTHMIIIFQVMRWGTSGQYSLEKNGRLGIGWRRLFHRRGRREVDRGQVFKEYM